MLKERRNATFGLPSDLTEALGVRELKASALKVGDKHGISKTTVAVSGRRGQPSKETATQPVSLCDVEPQSLAGSDGWCRVRGYLNNDKPMQVDSMPLRRKAKPKWSSSSKYFVVAHERLSKEDLAEALTNDPSPSLFQVDSEDTPSHTTKRRRRKALKEAESSAYGHFSDALLSRIRRMDALSARNKSIANPSHHIFWNNSSFTGSSCQRQETHATNQRRAATQPHRQDVSDSRQTRLVDLSAIAAVGDGNSSSTSEDEEWIRDEDVLAMPSDHELKTLPVTVAMQRLLDAQRALILGLGRLEEHWKVRLERKQAERKVHHPRTYKRAALLDGSSSYVDDSVYKEGRHQYLVRKLADLSRKHKALAERQERQFGGLSDQIEIEKRSMLMQLLDMEREENRIRNTLRKLDFVGMEASP